ncbi:YSIRK-type signal peptide-containing protein [Lactobacillus delbrueckii subsp. bulgaricus]
MIEAKKSARNKLQKMERNEQHYSFRKVNTDLASVLLGFSLGGLAITLRLAR